MKKIKDYLEIITVPKENASKLNYLRLTNEMGFHLAFVNTLNQITEPFPYMQTHKVFTILERDVQISIARKRLWLLLHCLSKLKKHRLLFIIDDLIAFAFCNSKQKCLEFSLNGVENNYLEKFILPQPEVQSNQMFGAPVPGGFSFGSKSRF